MCRFPSVLRPVIPANFPVIPAQAGISADTPEAVEIPFYNGMTALFFSSYYFPVIPAQAGISAHTPETDQTPIYIGVTRKIGVIVTIQ